jgi:hypothetical protein
VQDQSNSRQSEHTGNGWCDHIGSQWLEWAQYEQLAQLVDMGQSGCSERVHWVQNGWGGYSLSSWHSWRDNLVGVSTEGRDSAEHGVLLTAKNVGSSVS